MINDVSYIIVIVSMFLISGIALPYINDGFQDAGFTDEGISSTNFEGISQDAENNVSSFEGSDLTSLDTNVSIFDVIWSIGRMFIWYGTLPVWLDLILLIPRIAWVILAYRLIRSGGG